MTLSFVLLVTALLVIAAIGLPIAFAKIVAGLLYLFWTGQDVGLAAGAILESFMQSFLILAVPLFIFAANVMSAGGITERILQFCLLLVGRFRGGLAHVNVVASLIFAGMSGSAIADAAGVGRVVIEMMTKGGRYTPGFAAAITAASATIGPIIPPSIPMVLYALVSGQSIGYLFLGGIIPGILMAASLMVAIAIIARKRNFPVEPPVPLVQMPRLTARAFPALLLPIILLSAIYGGATTPTEAAAVAAAYAVFLAMGIYRSLSLRGLIVATVETSKSSATVALIVGAAFLFNYAVATERVPQALALWFSTLEISPLMFLIVVNLVFLAMGCLFDVPTVLLIVVPLLLPTAISFEIDLVHFGVVAVVNTMIGLITPPYGVLLFVINGITGIPLKDIIREIWVFVAVLIVALFTMVLFPDLVLWLPRIFGYKG